MKKLKPLVFLPPFVLCAAMVALNFADAERFTAVMTGAYQWVLNTFGWLVSLLAFAMLVLCAGIYASPFGRTVLGGPGARRLLTPWQLFTIILCTNIAIGVLFWGPVEPLYYLSEPPPSTGAQPNTPEAALFAISTVYLHWTSTPYAIGSIVGLMFAFAYYNMEKPFSLESPLSPLLGSYSAGPVGQLVDAVCLYTLVAGMAAALAGAALLLGGGVNHVLGIAGPPSDALLGIITALIVGTFTVSAASGLMRGIRILSHVNTVLLVALLGIIFLLGPTRFILGFSVEGFGHFLAHYFERVLFTGAAHQETWPQQWTQMQFSAWFAWAPVMGVFLGRIAYGYTVRAYLLFNVVLPAVFTGVWMAVFCGATVHAELYEGANLAGFLHESGPEGVLYAFMQRLPLAGALVPVLLVTAFLSFVTAADSNVSAMSGISSTGISPESPEPAMGVKIAWGAILGLVAWIMVTFARLDGIRMLSNLGGLPSLFLCLAICGCVVRVALEPARFDVFRRGGDAEGQQPGWSGAPAEADHHDEHAPPNPTSTE